VVAAVDGIVTGPLTALVVLASLTTGERALPKGPDPLAELMRIIELDAYLRQRMPERESERPVLLPLPEAGRRPIDPLLDAWP
jgi:hypothetical protein